MSRRDDADRLLRGLLGQPPLTDLAAIAARHPAPVFLVGGALRDALLARAPADLDLGVADELEVFVDRLAERCGRRPTPIGDPWRDTRRLHWRGLQVDVARLLGEVESDLAQRDFAINAMALRLPAPEPPSRGLIDPHGGRRDLATRRIRCFDLGALDADPLRLLRAARYAAALPGFEVDPDTLEAVRERVESIDAVAAERVQTEWRLLLDSEGWLQGVELAAAAGLLHRTLPGTPGLAGARAWAASAECVDFEPQAARLAALLVDCEPPPEQRRTAEQLVELRWPQSLARFAARAAAWSRQLAGADEDRLAGLAIEDHEAARLAAALARARSASAPEVAAAHRLTTLATRAREKPWVTGTDLLAWGMPEGPAVGAVLEAAWRGQVLRRWRQRDEARRWAMQRAGARVST